MISSMIGVILLFLSYIVGKALGYQDGHSDGFVAGCDEREEYEVDPEELAEQAEQEQFFIAQVQGEFSKVYKEMDRMNEALTSACVSNAKDIESLKQKLQEQVRH